MGIEIERKFLVNGNAWRQEVIKTLLLRQGYLATNPECAIRVRLSNESAWITVKGKPANGVTPEFEYPIPAPDAAAMLDTLAKRPIIEKKRHIIPVGKLIWEVDEFLGSNAGLIIAEVELDTPDQNVPLPAWINREVTGDARYYNTSLVAHPFSAWEENV